MPERGPLQLTVVYSPGPRQVREWSVTLAVGATVRDALSDLAVEFPLLDLEHAKVGVWGRSARLGRLLRPEDRIEVYRPLRVDPKVARRERFSQQGARATGLFARQRPGSKAGY